MKLQKLKHSRYKGTEYYKFVVNIPTEVIEKLGWVEGQEVSSEVKGSTLVLKPRRDGR
jgi:hypothetical protein